MNRVRFIAAVLACLALLAGALNVAASAQPLVVASHDGGVGHAPCSDCPDCTDKAPCPMPVADCLQVHTASAPAMLVAFIVLPAAPKTADRWTASARTLSGLSPPPDPFPPRS